MKRKTREGFVIYHDTILNILQYLQAEDVKAVIVEAANYSMALANREPTPTIPDFAGPVLGAFRVVLRAIESGQRDYDKKAARCKMIRQLRKLPEIIEMSNDDLIELGYTIYDIAALRECDVSELRFNVKKDYTPTQKHSEESCREDSTSLLKQLLMPESRC